MKVISETYQANQFDSGLLSRYLGGMSLGVFDIETLGLNPSYCPLILAGFISTDPAGVCRVTQYFAEIPEEEKDIIEKIREDLLKTDCIITYNGRHFDIPFVEKRSAKLGFDDPSLNVYNLDLYQILNGYSQIRYVIKDLKQKTVEKYMGLESSRGDLISGAESIELYERFLAGRNPREKDMLQQKILLHNHDDILQLYKLLPVLRQVDIHRAFYALGFPVKGISGWPTLNVSAVRTGSRGLSFAGRYSGEAFSYISYDSIGDSFSCEFREDRNFEFHMHVERHKGNIFVNLREYFDEYGDFKEFPHFINDFIHISDGRNTNHMEVNAFIISFLKKFMEDKICPLMIL